MGAAERTMKVGLKEDAVERLIGSGAEAGGALDLLDL